MTDYSDDSRILRLNTLYRECGERSVNSFSKVIGVPQATTNNYILGKRLPNSDFCRKVITAFPQYNFNWLYNGEGDKYNRKYVKVNEYDQEKIDEEKENASFYDTIIATLKDQIRTLTKLCDSKDEQIELLKKLIEEKEK